jgi:hypothetical protein
MRRQRQTAQRRNRIRRVLYRSSRRSATTGLTRGGVNARDTNDDGSGSILAGQIGNDEFTGHLERNYCRYALTMPTESIAAGSPVR